MERYHIQAAESVFIDDNPKNIEMAKSLGFNTIHILPDTDLKQELINMGIEIH